MAIEITGRINLDSSSVDEAVKSVGELNNELNETNQIADNLDRDLQGSFDNIRGATDLLGGSVATLVGGLAVLNIENEYIENLQQGAVGALAFASGVDQLGRGLVQFAKNQKVATVAQRAFNIVASLNPYVLIAATLIGATAAFIAISKAMGETDKSQQRVNESAERLIELRKEQIQLEEQLSTVLAKNAQERLQAQLNSVNARLQLLDEESKRIVENATTIENATELINQVEDEKTKLRLERIGLERSLENEVNKEQVENLSQREKLLTAQDASERQIFFAREQRLLESIRLFGEETNEGRKAFNELEVLRATELTRLKKFNEEQNTIAQEKLESDRLIAQEIKNDQDLLRDELEFANLTQREQQEKQLEDFFELQRDRAAGNLELLREIDKQEREGIARIREEFNNEQLEKQKAQREQQLQVELQANQLLIDAERNLQDVRTQAGFQTLNILNEIAGENQNFQKILFLAQKGLAAGEIITNSIRTAAELKSKVALGVAKLPNPATATIGAAEIAAATKGLVSNKINTALSLATLAATTFNPSGGGTSTPASVNSTGGGGGVGSAAIQTAVPNFDITSTNIPTVGGPGSINTDPRDTPLIRAFVSETDLTNTNKRIDLIKNGSEL